MVEELNGYQCTSPRCGDVFYQAGNPYLTRWCPVCGAGVQLVNDSLDQQLAGEGWCTSDQLAGELADLAAEHKRCAGDLREKLLRVWRWYKLLRGEVGSERADQVLGRRNHHRLSVELVKLAGEVRDGL